jgi:hypothetical protein
MLPSDAESIYHCTTAESVSPKNRISVALKRF